PIIVGFPVRRAVAGGFRPGHGRPLTRWTTPVNPSEGRVLQQRPSNREKHGIDFDEAQALWDDPYLIEAPANVTDEPRFLAVGMIGARHWTAVYTYRSDRVRIISVRRARKQEIDHYEGD
ncbi:BrnT family toxin, partial [Paracoccus sp. MC1854]|uniref:BrnT family toxin n=1 Tax=Paracoccus sp. MC1854 TaxID=2760306 RepID=UPI00210325C2